MGFLTKYAKKDMMEKLILDYKRGKFVEVLYGNFSKTFNESRSGMNQALSKKYTGYISRRTFEYFNKIQKGGSYDAINQKWNKKQIQYQGNDINMKEYVLSDASVRIFVRSMNMGDIYPIPGFCGVSRNLSALVQMVLELHLNGPALNEKLVWLNGIENHYVFEFSDDGAPESKDTTMSIGSLTLWNLGSRVRSREYQYPLHTVSCGEKEEVLADMWALHTNEMLILENNTMNVNNNKVTIEFQPSADQAWQCWANNELTTSASYPSIFAKVHKSELSLVGQSFEQKWAIPTMESRDVDMKKLNEFMQTINPDLAASTKHTKKLEFMAATGIRQLGEPRIGMYAERQRPEPFHLEVYNWEHTFNLLYIQCVQRNVVDKLIEVLKTSVSKGGCGLKSVAVNIEEHYKNEAKRCNKLANRLIGAQAISLAKYGLRAVDVLKRDDESPLEKMYRALISKIFESLRGVGVLANSVVVDNTYPVALEKICTMYFNLYALFFIEYCNSTVWMLVPYHAEKLFKMYRVGYGILSMQGKEAKHSQIKYELKNCSNRHIEGEKNKWYQLMESSYVRTFYLPYEYPKKTYTPHFESRNPSAGDCGCYRKLTDGANVCDSCALIDPYLDEIACGEGPDAIKVLRKPLICDKCNCRFADDVTMDKHRCLDENLVSDSTPEIIPLNLITVLELKTILKEKGGQSTGSKAILVKALEHIIAYEKC